MASCSFAIIACSKDTSMADNAATKPDNTAVNKQDRDTNAKTPMDQSESNAADVKITADIRRSVMDDKSLSTDALQCQDHYEQWGHVTLRGSGRFGG